MNDQATTLSDKNKLLKLLLKLVITIACFWYISQKIDWKQAWNTIKTANWLLVAAALLVFAGSKYISAIRLNLYFKNISIHLDQWQNLKLYWLGMFYNLFLPGSISGDAYKVIVLKKRFGVSYKKISTAVLLDRFGGLLGLLTLLALFGSFTLKENWLKILLIAFTILSILAYNFIILRWLPDYRPSINSTFLLAVLVQSLQAVCIFLILKSLGTGEQLTEYIFIFFLSSIASVLPLTIGGLGIRELVFLEGSKWFGLNQEIAVAGSLIFYLITMFTSAFGTYFIFHDPLKKIRTQ